LMGNLKNSTFGRYEILSELGQGAMGVVYKARDPNINRLVAIKTISLVGQSPVEESEYRQRFVHEAQAAGRLSHPHIVTIFDFGEDPETHTPYIVMEYVAGPSLEQVMAGRGRLPLKSTLRLVQELAEALDYAHSEGIVHRDIKPGNILMTNDGHPKITDFGIAKLNHANLTQLGNALGTPAYMSPEQLNGELVDGRSDLFSLGVILYALLTGHRPFQGNSALTVSFKVVNRDPVPVSAFDSELPAELDYIVSRVIAKHPADRYQTGMEMALDLKDLHSGTTPRSKPSQTQSSNGKPKRRADSEPSFIASAEQTVANRVDAVDTARAEIHKSGVSLVRHVLNLFTVTLHWQLATGALLLLAVIGIGAGLRNQQKAVPSADVANPAPTGSLGAIIKTNSLIAAAASPDLPSDVALNPGTVVPGNSPSAANPDATNKIKARSKPSTKRATGSLANNDHTSAAAKPSTGSQELAASSLQVWIGHHFTDASLLIWMDDKLVYTHALSGEVKKRMVLFKGVQGYASEILQVPAGEHRIRVRVQSLDDSYNESASLTATLPPNGERTLRIEADKHKALHLTLE
jgi:serine/threonine protein kinase